MFKLSYFQPSSGVFTVKLPVLAVHWELHNEWLTLLILLKIHQKKTGVTQPKHCEQRTT